MRLGFVLLVAGLAAGCDKDDEQSATTAPPPPTSTPPPIRPPSVGEDVTFAAPGGPTLKGRFYLSEPNAPILVLVHRFQGDWQEWKPVIDSAITAEKRYSVLAFDLRGHGDSKSAEAGKERIDWAVMKPEDMPKLVEDVRAAVRFGLEATKGSARGVVLAGSSLGAALVARAASMEPTVTALVLVSPGASINGLDVYHPFSQVRQLPSLLVGARGDQVSREPLAALGKMARGSATVKEYEGGGHGALGLASDDSPFTKDLGSWLSNVYDEKPRLVSELDTAPSENSGR